LFWSIISLVNIPASTKDLPIVSIPLLNSFAFFNMSAFLIPDSTPSLVKKFLTAIFSSGFNSEKVLNTLLDNVFTCSSFPAAWPLNNKNLSWSGNCFKGL